MKTTNANRAVLFSIIGLCLVSIVYRFFPREVIAPKTTVRVDLWRQEALDPALQDENSVFQNLITQFEEEHPGIVIVPVYHNYQEVIKKLFEPDAKASVEDEKTDEKIIQRDLVFIDMDWLPNLLRSGMLEPLDGFPQDDPDVDMLYEMSKLDGKSFALPFFSNPSFFYYNIDILKAAGFDRPPKDRDELLRYSRVLKEKQIAGIGFALADENHSGMLHKNMLSDVYSWFWDSDIYFMEDDEAQFSARPVRETLSFLNTLSEENLISPESFSQTEQMKIDAFRGGKTAMMIAPFSALPEIMERVTFEWGISSVPAAASYIGNPLFASESFGMGIYAQSEHKDEAWKFLAFLAGAEQNEKLASMYHVIPKNQNAQSIFAIETPQIEKALALLNAGKEVNEFDTEPGVFIMEDIIRAELRKMMQGEQSPELTAEAIQAQLSE
jgi:multiple sugar transport system substrate-binding protein